MDKKEHQRIAKINNRAKLIELQTLEAFRNRNWALMESSLTKLFEALKWASNELTTKEMTIIHLKDNLADCQESLNEMERSWLLAITKDEKVYQKINKQLDEIYQKRN
jgi:predicted  nucleic acid-binding Zn-ribbon protein